MKDIPKTPNKERHFRIRRKGEQKGHKRKPKTQNKKENKGMKRMIFRRYQITKDEM